MQFNQDLRDPVFQTDLSVKLWKEIQGYKTDFHTQIEDLGSHLNGIIQRHEYEYNQAYNIFVKHKETEIKAVIDQISAQIGDKAAHDRKMERLQESERKLRAQQILDEQQLYDCHQKIEKLTAKLKSEVEQKDFYHNSAVESKQQKMLLKIALNRMESECDDLKLKYKIADADLQYTNQLQQQISIAIQSSERIEPVKSDYRDILKQQSLLSISEISQDNKPERSYGQGKMLTENLKFEQFLNIVFNTVKDKKPQIIQFVNKLETAYSDKIQQLQVQMDKLRKQLQQERTKNTTTNQSANDLETLFVQCVEDVRKDVMKRRIKTDLANQRHKPINPYNTVNGQEGGIESTLVKIADLAKGRVKFEEFTYNDRTSVLDLFVNSEEVIIKMHELVFGAQKQTHSKQLATMRKPSDLITLSDHKERTMMTHDSSLKEFLTRPPGILLGHSAVPNSQRNFMTTIEQSNMHKKRLSVQPKDMRFPDIVRTPSQRGSGTDTFLNY